MATIICVIIGLIAIGTVHEKYGAKGCFVAGGCLALLFVALVGIEKISSFREEYLVEKEKQAELRKAHEEESARIAKANAEARRIQEEKRRIQAEKKRIQEAKDEKIRSFALKDAPKVWAVYQSLHSEIDIQNGKIEELRKTLEAFGKDPDRDVDFQRICDLRDDMIRSRKALRTKLEDAYIASRKYEASPSRKDYQELHKKALEDGILEADAAEAKFKEMRLNK